MKIEPQIQLDFLQSISESFFDRRLCLSLEVCNFIACQFALESDFGKSHLALFNYNISGMKSPHRRYSLAIDSCDGFAVYRDWDDCKSDYLLWIFYNRPYQNALENLDSFKLFLRDSGYCPEKGYIQRIESIYNHYFTNSKN